MRARGSRLGRHSFRGIRSADAARLPQPRKLKKARTVRPPQPPARCIAYLTIEAKGPIPDDLKDGCGDWLFGCDVCQEVCPWNRKPSRTADPAFAPRPDLAPAAAAAIAAMTDAELEERFAGTPLDRPGPAGLRRNATTVLRNQGLSRHQPRARASDR